MGTIRRWITRIHVSGRRWRDVVCLSGVLVVSATIGSVRGAGTGETLIYHEIQVDDDGLIIPWYSDNPGVAYDHNLGLVWNWWKNSQTCPNGVKYTLQHQIWSPSHNPLGIGGDQVAMALSSWNLLWAYSGDSSIVDNMRYLADEYLARSLSSPTALWPNLPFPYNVNVHSGVFNGDMMAGVGVLQPDKAGSLGAELVTLYEITGAPSYLQAAIRIADSLAAKVTPGDGTHSPWPYRVNATTGAVVDAYTTNWTGAIRLFDELIRLGVGNVAAYGTTRQGAIAWLKAWPMTTNSWGPFFEDVARWSDTEINADTLAWYILEHPSWSTHWAADSRGILDWSYATFANTQWSQYGATAINEQTSYPVPGNSHTARHWSLELLYAEKTGDTSRKAAAIRGLHWATYMVDFDGKNRYPENEIWMTDGYGDYVRHYLRAMAAQPELAPAAANHLLRSTSVVGAVNYTSCGRVTYSTFDTGSRELLRLGFAPTSVTSGGVELPRLLSLAALDASEGYTFQLGGDVPGQIRVRHDYSGDIVIEGLAETAPEVALPLTFANRSTLSWSASPYAFSYDVYRGTIQAGSWNPNSTCLRSRRDEPSAVDPEIPAPNTGYYYLVSGVNACGEGTLGAASSGASRTSSTCEAGISPYVPVVTFDDLVPNTGLNGVYPTAMIDWGQGAWLASGPWLQLTTNSVSFSGSGQNSATVTFLAPQRLVRLDAFNGGPGASTVTLTCGANPTTQVALAPGQLMTISTGWADACTNLVIDSSNGWHTNFDNLVIQ